jgi:hypothetical protein
MGRFFWKYGHEDEIRNIWHLVCFVYIVDNFSALSLFFLNACEELNDLFVSMHIALKFLVSSIIFFN